MLGIFKTDECLSMQFHWNWVSSFCNFIVAGLGIILLNYFLGKLYFIGLTTSYFFRTMFSYFLC